MKSDMTRKSVLSEPYLPLAAVHCRSLAGTSLQFANSQSL